MQKKGAAHLWPRRAAGARYVQMPPAPLPMATANIGNFRASARRNVRLAYRYLCHLYRPGPPKFFLPMGSGNVETSGPVAPDPSPRTSLALRPAGLSGGGQRLAAPLPSG